MGIRSQYANKVREESPIFMLFQDTNDYTIYTHFIGRELKFKEMIHSPIRVDADPTFNIYAAKEPRWDDQILFKDFNGESGNVFKFVSKFASFNHGLVLTDIKEIISYIRHNLGLDGASPIKTINKIVIAEDPEYNYQLKHGKWTRKHLEFWEDFGVPREVLDKYCVYPVDYLLNEFSQIKADFRYTVTFAYWIYDKFKLYQPYEENFAKFYNQCPPNYMQGMQQCTMESESLLVTKAMKDILVFQAHTEDWIDSVAPHGEGYILDENTLYWMLTNYRRITIIYDPDYTGVRGARRLRNQLRDSKFNTGQEIRVRFMSNHRIMKRGKLVAPVKDISDYRLMFGESNTRQKINELLYG